MTKKHQSKFRHVYAEDVKIHEKFLEIPKPYTTGEDHFCSSNHKYYAVHKASAGGPVVVGELAKPGRFDLNQPCVTTHNGRVLASRWNPFVDNMIATASEDMQIHLNLIPDDFCYGKDESGNRFSNINTPVTVLKGHQKKVTLIDFHPAASNILASGSHERCVKCWDISTGDELMSVSTGDVPFSLGWNYAGTQLAFTSKDKKLTIMDPRQAEKATSFVGFKSTKASKLFWMGRREGMIGATCYSSGGSKRAIRIFDLRNTEKPLQNEELLDNSSSVLMPHYDADINILWTYGKGDGGISFYDCDGDIKFLGVNRSSTPAKGGFFAPKLASNTTTHEIQLFLKLIITGNTCALIPFHFTAPRKTHDFCPDIYPDTRSNQPALNGSDFWEGKDAEPLLISMNPELRGDLKSAGFEKKLTRKELETENADLRAQIEDLKKQLEAAQG